MHINEYSSQIALSPLTYSEILADRAPLLALCLADTRPPAPARWMLHMLTTLSESPSSTVFVATREDLDDGAFLVVKTFSQSAIRHYGDGVGQRLLRERCALEQLSHPNIIDYLGFSHDANNFYITLEHAGGGEPASTAYPCSVSGLFLGSSRLTTVYTDRR